MAHDAPEALLREQLEQFALGQLSPTLGAALEARIAAEPAVAALFEEVRESIAAVRATLRGEAPPATLGEADEEMIAAYLDGALRGDALAAMEARLARDPALLARAVQRFRELQAASDPDVGPALAEKFLAGDRVDFVKREQAASDHSPATYAELSEAVEERKRRYLQFGN